MPYVILIIFKCVCWGEGENAVQCLRLLMGLTPVPLPASCLQDRVKFHVLLTTYEMVSKHLAQIQKLDWAALVVDEAHRLKNATSRLFQVGWTLLWLFALFDLGYRSLTG